MIDALLVGLGGVLGALLRFAVDAYFVSRRLAHPERKHWPHATLVVNIAGSFLIGAVAGSALLLSGADPEPGRGLSVGLSIGLAGGLTTFSSWSVATVGLWEEGRRRAAVVNVVLNLLLGLAAAAAGFAAFASGA